jgi:hypothetical protein
MLDNSGSFGLHFFTLALHIAQSSSHFFAKTPAKHVQFAIRFWKSHFSFCSPHGFELAWLLVKNI